MRTGKQQRINGAKLRQNSYELLTLEQRLIKLNAKLGYGKGAIKERAKIAKQIAKRDNKESSAEKIKEAPILSDDFVGKIGDVIVEKPKKKAKERRAADRQLRHKSKE